MIEWASISSFSDEMFKIGNEAIPLIHRLPQDPRKTLKSISDRIDRSKRSVLGYGNVAVDVSRLGDLEDLGFKRTRLAIPLPGERIGTPTWRRGRLHAHMAGDHYLIHKDAISPHGIFSTLSHGIREGIPAAIRRVRQAGEKLTVA